MPETKAMKSLALNGVTVVNTRDGSLARDMAVVIEDGKIATITPAGGSDAQSAAKSIDARGKFVVPGYLDMHAHPLGARDQEGSLALLLAHGVTGFRQMSGSPEMLASRREGTLLPAEAPELLVMPGTVLTPFNAGSPEAAIAEIQKQKEAGADFIKMVETGKPTFFAALGEAKRLGLPFAGHIPASVDVAEAAEAGMYSMEHLLGSPEACSTAQAELLLPPAGGPPRGPALDIGAPGAEEIVERALANPILMRPPTYVREQKAVEGYSAEKAHALAARFAAAGVWQVPTLIRVRTMEIADDPVYRNDPNLRFMPPHTRQMWEALAQQFVARIPAPTRKILAQLFSLQLGLIKIFKEAGVKMAAGSDFGGGWCIPGAGLHQEFELLSEAGLSPLEILQMTTLDGAAFLGREASMGTVEAGKQADLVLLDANPLDGVQNLKKIHGVVRRGAYHSADMLDALKNKTADRQSSRTPSVTGST